MHRPQVLYLTHRVPYPPNRGDRIRTFHILRHLAQRADVTLACLAEEPVEPASLDALNALCRHVEIIPIDGIQRWIRAGLSCLAGRTITEGAFASPNLKQAVQRIAATTRFDAALTSSSSLAQYLELPELRAVPAWVDLIDVDSQKWLDYAAARRGPKAWLYGLEGRRLRALETELGQTTNGLFVVSDAEADLYRGFAPAGPIHAIPNGVDTDYFRPTDEPVRPECVFVGALDYLPNIDAATWFSREIWPEIHRRRPEARFNLVGREPAHAVRELAEIPGVNVIGTVPDVRPFVASAAAVVVPLRIARGVQNKLLEAMSMGKAIVTTLKPLSGLPITPGIHCLIADQPETWVEPILNLFDQQELRSALGTAAWSYIQTHHQWSTCLRGLDTLMGLEPKQQMATGARFQATGKDNREVVAAM